MMSRRLLLLGMIVALQACGPQSIRTPDVQLDQLETIRRDELAVTADVSRGGAVIDLRLGSSGNLIDSGDHTGRQLQASLYNGHWGPDSWPCHDASQVWGWNPVQEGNACQDRSGGRVLEHSAVRLVTETTPQQWNSALGVSHVTLRQTAEILAPGVLRIDYTVTNHETFPIGADNWHELPCLYLLPGFTRGAIGGAGQVREQSTSIGPVELPGAEWLALSTIDGLTVALVAPGRHLWTLDFGDRPLLVPAATLLQAWQWLALAPEQTGTATAWIVVGASLDQVRARIAGI